MTDVRDHLIGRVLDGRFTLQSVLGRGGMGVVYQAHQASLERAVALKLMSGVDPDREAEFQRRFFLEASTAAKLKHPNTITVFDYGSTELDGERVFFIAMELLEGITLSKLLSDEGALPVARAVHIATQMCRSLREAHAAGVVHRDLKPGNIMLVEHDTDDVEGDFVKVLDFGLAKSRQGAVGAEPGITRAGTFMGSPRYVAPEQINGKLVDARADIYSFGCVLYRMLTGTVPFDGEQAVDILMKHLKDPVPPMQVPATGVPIPPALEELTRSCLAKRVEDRIRSMEDVLAVLRQLRQNSEATGPVLRPTTQPSVPMSPAVPVVRRVDSSSIPVEQGPDEATRAINTAQHTPVSAVLGPLPSQQEQWAIGVGGDGITADRPATTVARRAPPWRAVAAGAVLGVAVVASIVAWRLSQQQPSSSPSALITPMTIAITSEPAGVDVFEVVGGGSSLVGITPLSLPWSVTATAPPRQFRLIKRGYINAAADVATPTSPAANGVIEVNAKLRPQP